MYYFLHMLHLLVLLCIKSMPVKLFLKLRRGVEFLGATISESCLVKDFLLAVKQVFCSLLGKI